MYSLGEDEQDELNFVTKEEFPTQPPINYSQSFANKIS